MKLLIIILVFSLLSGCIHEEVEILPGEEVEQYETIKEV